MDLRGAATNRQSSLKLYLNTFARYNTSCIARPSPWCITSDIVTAVYLLLSSCFPMRPLQLRQRLITPSRVAIREVITWQSRRIIRILRRSGQRCHEKRLWLGRLTRRLLSRCTVVTLNRHGRCGHPPRLGLCRCWCWSWHWSLRYTYLIWERVRY